jgi:hypothetical protein
MLRIIFEKINKNIILMYFRAKNTLKNNNHRTKKTKKKVPCDLLYSIEIHNT